MKYSSEVKAKVIVESEPPVSDELRLTHSEISNYNYGVRGSHDLQESKLFNHMSVASVTGIF